MTNQPLANVLDLAAPLEIVAHDDDCEIIAQGLNDQLVPAHHAVLSDDHLAGIAARF